MEMMLPKGTKTLLNSSSLTLAGTNLTKRLEEKFLLMFWVIAVFVLSVAKSFYLLATWWLTNKKVPSLVFALFIYSTAF